MSARDHLSKARCKVEDALLALGAAESLLPGSAWESLEMCDRDRDVRGGYDASTSPIRVHVGVCAGKEHGFDHNRLHLYFEAKGLEEGPEPSYKDMTTALLEAVEMWVDGRRGPGGLLSSDDLGVDEGKEVPE